MNITQKNSAQWKSHKELSNISTVKIRYDIIKHQGNVCVHLCINPKKFLSHLWSEVKKKSLNHVQLFGTPWTILSMEFSRPEYWSGWPFLSPGDLPNPGTEPGSPALPTELSGKPFIVNLIKFNWNTLSRQN